MRQYKITNQKAEAIDTESVHHYYRCVKYLSSSVYGDDKQHNYQKICFATDFVESVFFYLSDQYEYQAEEPEHLKVPQRAGATGCHYQEENRLRHIVHGIECAGDQHVVIPENPAEHQKTDR